MYSILKSTSKIAFHHTSKNNIPKNISNIKYSLCVLSPIYYIIA